ncbi:Dicarboxylate/amino acid:cation symporter [Candidatus Hepatincolaceae symbiont of Richtersius coronifer]
MKIWHLWTSIPLWKRSLAALTLGIMLGLIFPNLGIALKPVGDSFLNLLKMIVIPLVFISLLNSIITAKTSSSIGKMTLKTLIWVISTAALAVIMGLIVASSLDLGGNLNNIGDIKPKGTPASPPTIIGTILGIIPSNLVMAFIDSNILQIIFITVIIAASARAMISDKTYFYIIVENWNDIITHITHGIIELLPIGIFALLSYTIANFGYKILVQSGKVVIVMVIMYSIQLFVVFPIILKVKGHSIRVFFKHGYEAMVTAAAMSSSMATLPTTFNCAKKMGINKSVRSFVLPLGATINMNGAALYQTVVVVFMAQALDIPLSFTSYLLIFVTTIISAIGTSGVSGGGLATIQLVMISVGIPVEALALIMAIDRLIDPLQTVVNVSGDLMLATIIGKDFELKT